MNRLVRNAVQQGPRRVRYGMCGDIIQRPVDLRLASNTCQRFIATATPLRLAKQIIKVPTMGDSITEGTIVEWTVPIGHAVKEGDVVALVETDKVTVDIKADYDGVVTQHFGAINETVEVGAQLYEIDTDAQATVGIADATTTVAAPVDTNSQAINQAIESVHIGDNTDNANSSHHNSNRSPSIRFLGKDGWTQRLSGGGTEPEHAAPPVAKPAVIVPSKPNAVTVLDGSMLTSRYGRPNFSEEEMEALILGGANVAPTVVVPSSGAVFSISNKN